MQGLFIHCRPGFEGECAAEIHDKATALGIAGFAKAKADSGYVIFGTYNAGDAEAIVAQQPLQQLIFARQWFVLLALCKELSVLDRISGLLEVLHTLPSATTQLELETPDTNDGKTLLALCRSLERPLNKALREERLLRDGGDTDLTIHICFMNTSAAYVGYIPQHNSSPWPMGIPRLKFPKQAPSRSTLKLEEAILHFMTPEQREQQMIPGNYAVDLGASPGGWTWQLVRRSMYVIAIDNGPMADSIMESGLVTHVRADGFRYQPENRVQWLVCDMVEQPIRIADLIARWLVNGWCRFTIFNLKLPMKKRYAEVQQCLALISDKLNAANISHTMQARQLYHDREEVTVYIACD